MATHINDLIPGPSGHRLFGCFEQFRDSPLVLLQRCHQEYGDVVRLPVGFGTAFHLVFHPLDLEQVFHSRAFGRSDIAALFEPLAGGSMIIADGEQWKRQRKAVVPSFSRDRLRLLAEQVDTQAAETAARWEVAARRGEPIDLQAEMVGYAMSALTIFLIGRPLTPDEVAVVAPAWTESLKCMNRRISQPIPVPMWMPTPNNVRLKRAAGEISGVLLSLIRERRHYPQHFNSGGFLSDLIEYRNEETGLGLSDEEVRRELLGVFLAGFDTVASGMMWTFYYLSRFPDWQEKVRAESHEADAEEAPAESVLGRVFLEAIRLMPPLWLVDRRATQDVQLREHVVPAGTNVITSPYVTHRDARFWKNPETFDPDRFLEDHAKERPKYAYFPFGGGRMKCIGVGLAQLQMRAIAKHGLRRCKLVPLIGHSFELEPAFVLRTRAGLYVKPVMNQ